MKISKSWGPRRSRAPGRAKQSGITLDLTCASRIRTRSPRMNTQATKSRVIQRCSALPGLFGIRGDSVGHRLAVNVSRSRWATRRPQSRTCTAASSTLVTMGPFRCALPELDQAEFRFFLFWFRGFVGRLRSPTFDQQICTTDLLMK